MITVIPQSPILFATLGFPGSGKTHFSERFAKEISAFHLNSDCIRFEMFKEPVYSEEETDSVFRTMNYIAGNLIKLGVSVIYDANITLHVYRRRLQEIAEANGGQYVLLYFHTPIEEALIRIRTRADNISPEQERYYIKVSSDVLYKIKDSIEKPELNEMTIELSGLEEYIISSQKVRKILKLV